MKKRAVKIGPNDPVYAIGIVSRLLGIPEWTLRSLEKEGLVRPKRINKKIRVYSYKDIQHLEYIHYLMDEKGVNISGIKIILRMEVRE
ncbi:MAG: MerR family transcriptional regulator [Candidatus Omnitrophota bacterium]